MVPSNPDGTTLLYSHQRLPCDETIPHQQGLSNALLGSLKGFLPEEIPQLHRIFEGTDHIELI